MTAPRAAAAPVAPPMMARAPVRAAVAETSDEPEPEPEVEAASVAPEVEAPTAIREIEQLAEELRRAGADARKVTVLGTTSSESVALTTLTLARLMAREGKVAVVDLAASSPTMTAVSTDPGAPGLAELMQGEATFSEIITRDRSSRVNLVSAGRPGFDRTHLQSPRVALAIDALLSVYDHVLLDAGSASDLPADLLTAHARAVVVPDASMADDARRLMCEQLAAIGFSKVTMLTKPCEPSEAVEPGPRVVAA